MGKQPINIVDIANAIRYNASEDYKNRIPQATRENIVEVGNAIITYTPTRNEFIDSLINKIGKTIVSSRMAENKLAFFRGEDLEFGDTIEEVFVDMAKSKPYERGDGSPFEINKATVHTLYHKIDRELQYPLTIQDNDLRRAFTKEDGLVSLIDAMVNSLYSGKEHDEYVMTKELIGSYKEFFEVNVPEPNTDANCKKLVKAMKKYSQDLTFMSDKHNAARVMTKTPIEKQVLLIHKDAKVEIDSEYLAGVFNLSKAELEAKTVVVDDFGDNGDVYAALVDVDGIRIHKSLESTETIRNPKGRYTNYFLNSDGVMSISRFANMVIFKKKDTALVNFSEKNDVAMDIVVKDSEGKVINPTPFDELLTYRLKAGSYTYTATAEGYTTQTNVALTITSGQATGSAAVDVEVTLVSAE